MQIITITSITEATEPPINFRDNILFRGSLHRLIDQDAGLRRGVLKRCRKDLCYFVNALGWTYQAKPFPAVLPMILFPLQTRYMKTLEKDGGKKHFHIDKSRDMGLTWCSLFWIFWCWWLIPYAKFHIASWKEWMVDVRGHPGTHFGKLDHMLALLPESIRPIVRRNHERRKNIMMHPTHQSVITGESTSRRMGHQDRNMAALLDEFALMGENPRDAYEILGGIRPTTDCMIVQSTPKGVGTAFADYKSKAHRQFSFWWPDHPDKGRGLEGSGVKRRPKSGFYSDNVEGLRHKLTSPWYKQQKLDAVNEQEIAQEIDIDYAGSGWQYFPDIMLRRILRDDVMPPFHTGELVFDPDSGACKGFSEGERGPLSLWIHPNKQGWPSAEFDYVVGADVAAGSRDSTGAGHSNSCAAVLNAQTGEVVADLVIHGVDPADFAVMTVALCYYFRKAKLIWEGNGPGLHFGRTVTDNLRYGNIYYRRSEKTINGKETMEPGWWSTPPAKTWMLGAYRKALEERDIIEHSKQAVAELRMYQTTATGVIHAIAASTPDPTGARENHADRVIARGIAYRCLVQDGYNPLDKVQQPSRIVPANCLASVREHGDWSASGGSGFFGELGY